MGAEYFHIRCDIDGKSYKAMGLFDKYLFAFRIDAHHIQFAQHRGIGQKVGDQFTIPLCVKHHHQLHNCGMSERDFWNKIDIDPIPICSIFYDHYHEMWKNKDFFYDDSMLWVNVYNKLVPKIKKNIDFLLQPK